MAKGRILSKLVLTELSGVDDPCQEHARVSIMKRAPAKKTQADIAKMSFREALTGSLLADQVRETFYTAFDNLYEGKEAFRTAVIDELSTGGDGTVASTDFKTWLNSLVDQAVGAAKAAGAAKIEPADLTKHFNNAADAWLESQQQEQTPMFKFTTKAALQAAISKFAPATSTVQDVIDIHDSADQLKETALLPVEGPLAKAAPAADQRTAQLEKQVKVLTLEPDLRKHYDGLASDKQDAFLAKSASDQKAEVAALNVDDPVEYTTDAGVEVRKSAGAAFIAMAKQNDALVKRVDALSASNAESAIEKALQRYPNVNKGVATTILKSAANGTDADRQAAEEALTAMNKGNATAFVSVGSLGGGQDIEKGLDTPQGRMGAIVKRIAKDKGISEAHATVEAINDPEYAAAYKESLAAVPAVENAG